MISPMISDIMNPAPQPGPSGRVPSFRQWKEFMSPLHLCARLAGISPFTHPTLHQLHPLRFQPHHFPHAKVARSSTHQLTFQLMRKWLGDGKNSSPSQVLPVDGSGKSELLDRLDWTGIPYHPSASRWKDRCPLVRPDHFG